MTAMEADIMTLSRMVRTIFYPFSPPFRMPLPRGSSGYTPER